MVAHIAPTYVRTNPARAHMNQALPPVTISVVTPDHMTNFQRAFVIMSPDILPASVPRPMKNRVIAVTKAPAATKGAKNDAALSHWLKAPPYHENNTHRYARAPNSSRIPPAMPEEFFFAIPLPLHTSTISFLNRAVGYRN